MQTDIEPLPVHTALTSMGGVSDIEILDAEIRFTKNGCGWSIYLIGAGATYPFVLFKDGHRILSFSNPESLTNFFAGIHEPQNA